MSMLLLYLVHKINNEYRFNINEINSLQLQSVLQTSRSKVRFLDRLRDRQSSIHYNSRTLSISIIVAVILTLTWVEN